VPGIKKLHAGCVSLALIAVFSSASAEQPLPALQTLQWHDDATLAAHDIPTVEIAHDDVWQRIRSGFRIDDNASPNPLIAAHESWFAARPDNVRRLVERARPYLYHIVEELDRRAMPMEIALLPMIESAFNPTALSASAASGIWQFIPSTGRLYGLRQDNWYDGRRDFTAATSAALDYLGKLYLDFGDWQLALAAYNCGEGCVSRAIQKNVQQGLPTDYAGLSLPNETRHYVPKLLAIRNLIREPERHGLAIDHLPNEPYFNQVTVRASLDIHSAARLAGISSDEFMALNAAFPRKIIRSDTPVNLLVPADRVDKFQRNLEAGNWDTWQPYAARRGEQAEAIARRFDTSVARLKEHNQLHLKRGKLTHAQTILVPVKGRGSVVRSRETPDPETGHLHAVQAGETLYSIARRYGLGVAQLNEANPGLEASLRVGQLVRLPLASDETKSSQPAAFRTAGTQTPKPVRYVVARGDTLSAIARRFGLSLNELQGWNPSSKQRSALRPGQTLTIGRR
jgi:membrane-bound lytic murein transglycosylase D